MSCLKRLPTACGARFQKNATRNFTRTAEALFEGEAIVAAKSADGLTLSPDVRERRMRRDRVTQRT